MTVLASVGVSKALDRVVDDEDLLERVEIDDSEDQAGVGIRVVLTNHGVAAVGGEEDRLADVIERSGDLVDGAALAIPDVNRGITKGAGDEDDFLTVRGEEELFQAGFVRIPPVAEVIGGEVSVLTAEKVVNIERAILSVGDEGAVGSKGREPAGVGDLDGAGAIGEVEFAGRGAGEFAAAVEEVLTGLSVEVISIALLTRINEVVAAEVGLVRFAVAGLIIAGLIVAGLIIAGLIVAGLMIAGLIVAGLMIAGENFLLVAVAGVFLVGFAATGGEGKKQGKRKETLEGLGGHEENPVATNELEIVDARGGIYSLQGNEWPAGVV